MPFKVVFTEFAQKDFEKLAPSVAPRVAAAIMRVAGNPLPQARGGYGKPLANKSGSALAGLLKIKLRGDGIRIVYALREQAGEMLLVVISMREDNKAYTLAATRRKMLGV